MANLQELFKSGEEAVRALEEAREVVSARETRRNEIEALIIEMLARGETTGDRLVDLVFRGHGFGYEEVIEKYRALEERMRGKRGEFVLVEYSGEIMTRTGGIIGDPTYESIRLVRIGILTSEQLFWREDQGSPLRGLNRGVSLPTGKYVQFQPAWGSRFDIGGGTHILVSDPHYHLYTDLSFAAFMGLGKTQEHGIEAIAIGDEEVRQWMGDQHIWPEAEMEKVWHKVAELVDRLTLTTE